MLFVIEDDPVLCDSVVEFLEHQGHEVQAFPCAEDALLAAKSSPPDLAICDLNLPGMGGIELIEKLGEHDAGIVRIAVTADSSARTAVRAMRAGAYEYLEKPVDLRKLDRLIARSLASLRDRRELAWLRKAENNATALDRLLGKSPVMQTMRDHIASFAQLPAEAPPVLFLGETGVGKGLAAKTLHEQRFGDEAPWISVNCAALPDSLVEAELFGYEKSAFTDAKEGKAGLFEAAKGGTIFLDEIGEFGLEVQAKLLTLIESRSVRRLGSLRERSLHCAIVAASNVDLKSASRNGQFRPDLYHRLAGLTVLVPPLSERDDDLLILANSFLHEMSERYGRDVQRLSEESLARIQSYRWPGNIRELRSAIERAVILAPATAQELPAELLPQIDADDDQVGAQRAPASAASQARMSFGADGVKVDLPSEGIAFEELERSILKAALAQAGGNVTAAARLLKLNRDAMRYRIQKHGLDD